MILAQTMDALYLGDRDLIEYVRSRVALVPYHTNYLILDTIDHPDKEVGKV